MFQSSNYTKAHYNSLFTHLALNLKFSSLYSNLKLKTKIINNNSGKPKEIHMKKERREDLQQ